MDGCTNHNAPACNVIDTFVDQWITTKQRIYKDMADRVRTQCHSFARDQGILAQVSSRVKQPEHLRQKLLAREVKFKDGYKDAEHIEADIRDLAGVRIVLYLPNDKPRLNNYIYANYEVKHEIQHPKNEADKINWGYRGIHYVVSLKKDVKVLEKQVNVELQVVTMMQHTWAEVEHYFYYKSAGHGKVSKEERDTLKLLEQVVGLGDEYLERLYNLRYPSLDQVKQEVVKHHRGSSSPSSLTPELPAADGDTNNIPFPTTQKLRAFLFKSLGEMTDLEVINLGPVEVLLKPRVLS
ncbi:uncharacterized protein LTHEOB_7032 [Lasiodiplodia theobromae]|uniref:uncharacterized protein n=1 Tax=Lasiodiplodia theobromae TaxID=45133 RepID=UPI0015C36EAC|nr:uncharacterized protein LTHEOB_7032 [Lasiodiplodia theobromae]KAF4543298.1 hypothetical protein LTHEOB_7032 [Lasiodiplodia theobromae]